RVARFGRQPRHGEHAGTVGGTGDRHQQRPERRGHDVHRGALPFRRRGRARTGVHARPSRPWNGWLTMRPRCTVRSGTFSSLALALLLTGCGPGAGPTRPAATQPAGATSAPANGTGAFCDAAARLELADASNRASIQAGLEAATPTGLEAAVRVI